MVTVMISTILFTVELRLMSDLPWQIIHVLRKTLSPHSGMFSQYIVLKIPISFEEVERKLDPFEGLGRAATSMG